MYLKKEISRPHFEAWHPKSFEEFAFLQEDSKKYLYKRIYFPEVFGYVDDFEICPKNLKNYKNLSKYLKHIKQNISNNNIYLKSNKHIKQTLTKQQELTFVT